MTHNIKWAHATNVGPSHIAAGTPCQDAVAVRECTDRNGRLWIIAALSDGAGSCEHSELGAKYAVEGFTDFLAEALSEFGAASNDELNGLVRRGAILARRSLIEIAGEHRRDAIEYASTFLACVSDGERTALVQLGDGIIVLGVGANRRVVFRPQNGEYANVSFFLVEDDALDRLQVLVIDACPQQMVMVSDGLQDLLLTSSDLSLHPPLFDYLTQCFESTDQSGALTELSDRLTELLRGSSVTSRSTDDTSIIAIDLRDTAS